MPFVFDDLEEIVDELTEGLENSSMHNKNSPKNEKLCDAYYETNYQTKNETMKCDKSFTSESNEMTNDQGEDEYFIDEVNLKDRVESYTEEEKQEIKRNGVLTISVYKSDYKRIIREIEKLIHNV